MNRRHILKGMAAIAAQADLLPRLATAAPAIRRVRPADPAWPAPARWAELNAQTDGNLIEGHALFGSCESDPKGAACADALKNIGNPYWIADQPCGTQLSGWLEAWTPQPSVYVVKARHTGDVAAAVNFARDHRLRLAIKGGAHSYLGTSNAPDSLLVWTRAMNKVTLHDAFVATGCSAAPVPAVSAGAGTVWMDLYHAVTTEAGRYVQGGGCLTVGVAGLVQGGGFGSHSKAFGTAAASLLEAEIVTADGKIRTVNECHDPDLFWAIKGGGGGTFGVVTRLTLRTHDLPEFFGSASGKIKAKSDAAFKALIARFIGFYRDHLFNPHWGETVHIQPDNVLEISMSSQGLGNAEASALWRPFFDWVAASPERFEVTYLVAWARDSRNWWNPETANWIARDGRAGAPAYHGWGKGNQGECGAFIHFYDSFWIPASLLEEGQQAKLVDGLFAASRHQMVRLHFMKGLAGASPEARETTLNTAMNPAVVDAFALVIIADGQKPAYPGQRMPNMEAARMDAQALALAAAALRKLVPKPGSYVAESNYFIEDWQDAYWGRNYAKLRRVKAKYDPDGLFIVHHGVGSEDWSADGFTRRA
jgi:FAD/FMN-containing dehydrogenase